MEQQTDIIYARIKSPLDYQNGCPEPEFEWPQYSYLCLWYHTVESTEVMADGPFWKVQNSWGEGWGHKGFAYFAVEGGRSGTCNMNYWGGDYVVTKNETA